MMSQRFGPYGNVVARDTNTAVALGFTLRYGWTGRENDPETGWYYFRARYYAPGQRRFAQEDPLGDAGGGNVYAYAGGGPLEARDPSGTRNIYGSPQPYVEGSGSLMAENLDWPYPMGEDPFGGFIEDFGPQGTSHPIEWSDAEGYVHLVTMWVKSNDETPNVNQQMVNAAARAADASGYSSFTVSAFTSGDHECCAHYNGTAMDISALGGTSIAELAGTDWERISAFADNLEANPSVPIGSQILMPGLGVDRSRSRWTNDAWYRPGDVTYNWHTFMAPHIHFQWGPDPHWPTSILAIYYFLLGRGSR